MVSRAMPIILRFLMTLLAAATMQPLAVQAGEIEDGCSNLAFRHVRYTVCRFDPSKSDLRLFHADLSGESYQSFAALTRELWRDHTFLDFAMNGGMYHDDYSPVGLYVENGVEKRPLVFSEGYGNFHLLPNGVFYFGDGTAGVLETRAYAKRGLKPRFATQSGPMLVIDGALHPRFLPDSDSLKIRNGVGISRDGAVHFAISDTPVRFYDFAMLFRDVLDCPNALYLDGTISSVLLPQQGRHDRFFPMGPIIGVVSRVPD